jgi:hypothetical protein
MTLPVAQSVKILSDKSTQAAQTHNSVWQCCLSTLQVLNHSLISKELRTQRLGINQQVNISNYKGNLLQIKYTFSL